MYSVYTTADLIAQQPTAARTLQLAPDFRLLFLLMFALVHTLKHKIPTTIGATAPTTQTIPPGFQER